MGIEELGLGLSSVASFSIPPSGTVAIDRMATSASDCDRSSGNRDKRARPLLVAECCGSGKDNIGASCKAGKVKSLFRISESAFILLGRIGNANILRK